MPTLREHYRAVFHTPGAEQVLEHLSSYAGRLPGSERGGAHAVLAMIMRMMLTPDKAPRPRSIRSNGGRIEHG